MTDEAYSRAMASALTWPVEKSKLIFQGIVAEEGHKKKLPPTTSMTFGRVWRVLLSLPVQTHAMGMVSSGLQRGGSAFLMFYLQGTFYSSTQGLTNSYVIDQALAGGLSGMASAPFHNFWELIKIRGSLPGSSVYLYCLGPMILRHGIFDATFFAVNASVSSEHSSIRFAAAAASASFTNLLWDVWKTQQMEHFPRRIQFVDRVVRLMTWRSLLANYLIKGTDLTMNWFAVGVIKDRYFSRQE